MPQGGPFSPLAASIYLTDLDWYFDGIRRKQPKDRMRQSTIIDSSMILREITVSGRHSKRGWAERAVQRLKEQLVALGVSLNEEKTQTVNMLNGESFGLRRVLNRQRTGHFILMTPKKKARKAIKAKIREIIKHGGTSPANEIIARINVALAGWVNYFRVGNSTLAFSEVRDYLEMKVRTLLTRRKRRQKRSVGWRRWSNEYLYEVLELFWDWKALSPWKRGGIHVKVDAATYRTHNHFEESHWVRRLRENLTSGSDGEGLEPSQQVLRQPFTRQFWINEGEFLGLDSLPCAEPNAVTMHLAIKKLLIVLSVISVVILEKISLLSMVE